MGRSANRPAPKSGAALRYERQLREAAAALAAQAAQVASIVEAKISAPSPATGTWRMADLREGQCRFACTPHSARPEAHRFCGQPVAWKGGKPTSWCRDHLPVVSGAPGWASGGASEADVATRAVGGVA